MSLVVAIYTSEMMVQFPKKVTIFFSFFWRKVTFNLILYLFESRLSEICLTSSHDPYGFIFNSVAVTSNCLKQWTQHLPSWIVSKLSSIFSIFIDSVSLTSTSSMNIILIFLGIFHLILYLSKFIISMLQVLQWITC